MASSSSTRKWKYDVVFSWRGEDTNQNFLRDLESRLTENDIITLKVDTELKPGEEIGEQAFQDALESSMIALVIISQEYVSSKRCLDDLLKILECRKYGGLTLIPVLYHVIPSDLENPTTGAFAEAFAAHEKNFKEEVEAWKAAMTQVVAFRVYSLKNWSESDHADEIKSEHVDIIKNVILQTREHIMATDSKIEEMKNLLSNASSSSGKKWEYEVFFSFRGADIRYSFLEHLHQYFVKKKIKCYKDDIHLKIGQEIEPAIMKAIEDSMVVLIILSKDYASSRWCLDELRKAMKCREEFGQIVIPIFYNVDPHDAAEPSSGNFANAFATHRENFNETESSELAMIDVANISGWVLDKYSSEFQLIDDITKEIKRCFSHQT